MRPTRVLPCAVLVLLTALSGCTDEDSVTGPKPFRVVIEVTDPAGDPVAGLELGLAPDLPAYYQDNRAVPAQPTDDELAPPSPSPFFPSTAIEYRSSASGFVRVVVEDIEGALVKVVVDGEQLEGDHRVIWNGTDDSGARVPSGVYWIHLTRRTTAEGPIEFEHRVPMIYAALYPDQYLVGVTDSRGRIVIEDERFFPFLYPDLPPIPAVDETGQIVGMIDFGPAMRLTFVDPVEGTSHYFVRDVTGSGQLDVTWDPAP